MMRALKAAGLDDTTYLWTDDNLSTTYLFDALSSDDRELLCAYPNYGRVCCIKGFDARSFAFNTRAAPDGYEQQFATLRRVLELGLDTYGYVTLTSPHADGVAALVADLIDRLQGIDPNFPLRIVPLRIAIFTPVAQRLARDPDRARSLLADTDDTGRVFRFEAGHRSDAKSDGYSDLKPDGTRALLRVVDEDHVGGGPGQAAWSAGRCLRRLSPDSSIR